MIFPSVDTAWTNGNYILYLSDDLFVVDGEPVFAKDQVVPQDADGNYYFVDTELGGTFTFVMDSDVFTSIVVSSLESPFDDFNGTYISPIISELILHILLLILIHYNM